MWSKAQLRCRTMFRLAPERVLDISRVFIALMLATILSGCVRDAADRAYLAALRGEEEGMTRQEQIALVDRAIFLKPDRGGYYETRAIYRIDLQQFDRALADVDRDIALTSRPYAYYLRGLVLCQTGAFERSLPDFDTAIARQPWNAQFYRGRSLARSALGNGAGALADAESLVKRNPQTALSWHARGVALALLGRDAEAVVDFTQALAIGPELLFVREARVQAFERLGQLDNARADRAKLAGLRERTAGCAMCRDPFRY